MLRHHSFMDLEKGGGGERPVHGVLSLFETAYQGRINSSIIILRNRRSYCLRTRTYTVGRPSEVTQDTGHELPFSSEVANKSEETIEKCKQKVNCAIYHSFVPFCSLHLFGICLCTQLACAINCLKEICLIAQCQIW